ncbi:uncharacterized protein C9orf43 homolog isoform X2 [Equus quagga]|uniref:uncharacterized protein C9orf43 homolog isoform X2 n=1 Tax=Equus quagga TaxID=89248 RepID=UPI001EE15BD5|nr:uncharacterized protein C9orf43 homolog isoform X2 [Equus quagga]
MDLPDESQWDETTCNLAVCPHPQCWATIRRIERGHPRILGAPCKTLLDVEDKLPVVTIVNVLDSFFQAKRLAHCPSSGFTFTEARSLLSRGSRFDSKLRGRPRKALPGKDLIDDTSRSLERSHGLNKLSVLNLNKIKLPCPQDVRNMVVIWVPEEPEKHVTLAEKKHTVPSLDGEKKGKKSTVKDQSSPVHSGKQSTERQLGPPGISVPPSSPAHLFEQLNSEFTPFWNQLDMLPQELLKHLLPEEKTVPCPEMKTQLAMMRKKGPLKKSRPDSAISARMFLSVHRLTLQEAKKKSTNDPWRQNASHKPSGAMIYDPRYGRRTLPGQESDKKQQQQMKREGPTLKRGSTERQKMDQSANPLESFPSKENPELSKTELTNQHISTQMEVVLEAQERTPEDLSASTSGRSWNPELKLLRILQGTDDEDEDDQCSGAQSEQSLEG